jgi:oxygen-independent coproporphyrinogen-3 oxidase
VFSIYVHIPYCTSVCPYCDFNVYAPRERPEVAYVDALLAEMEAAASTGPWKQNRVATIYLGGGTPSLFAPASIARLIRGVRNLWLIEADVEVTLEATPESVSPASLAAFREAGVNRLSLGLQSMEARHLKTLGRLHSAADNEGAFEAARAAGFDNVNLDVIFAVPGQTVREWQSDLASVVALGPEHVSAYGLTFEPRTPFFARRAKGELQQADEDLEAAMFRIGRAELSHAGYSPYEISNFARRDRESRHNRSYWTGSSYLGLGAGAHSYVAGGWGRRWSNERLPSRYMEAVSRSGQALASEEVLTEKQARGEYVFLGLRQACGVNAAGFARRFGVEIEECFPRLRIFCEEGLLEPNTGGYRLTDAGLLIADTLFEDFF